jgi:hypothetical protein
VGKALILIGVAVGMGLLVYWLAAPRRPAPASTKQTALTPGAPPAPTSTETAVQTVEPARPPDSEAGPITPPKSEQEKERESLESRRAPLYARLHQDLGAGLKAVRPSDDDAATLDLYSTQDAPGNTIALLNLALHTNVAYYGFRHIRFFAPNPPGSIELYRLDAEASVDSAGNWQTFKK